MRNFRQTVGQCGREGPNRSRPHAQPSFSRRNYWRGQFGRMPTADKPQVLTLSRNEKIRRTVAPPGRSEGDGTRTRNHRIDSPVL